MKPTASLAPRLLAGFSLAALLSAAGLYASSRPARTAGGPIAVNVANTPLAVSSTDSRNKQPIQFSQDLFIRANESYGDAKVYTVPAGKRLVIESVNAGTYSFSPDRYTIAYSSVGGVEKSQQAILSFNLLPDGAPFETGTSLSHLYADDGAGVFAVASRRGFGGFSNISLTFSGYLVDI